MTTVSIGIDHTGSPLPPDLVLAGERSVLANRNPSRHQAMNSESQLRARDVALIKAQNNILSQIAYGAPVQEVFDKLLRAIEEYSNGKMLGSILLMDEDGKRLRHAAAPSLPEAYNAAVDGLPIGPSSGSCGTAAHRKELVIVSDIETDPLWEKYRQLALPLGLRACWSSPILSKGNKVLGTFAIYYREPRTPSPEELEVITLLSRTATIAIERHQIDAHRQLLLNEMVHRVKNTLASVQSIANQTLRTKLHADDWMEFVGRLNRLSDTHLLLLDQQWASVELHELISKSVIEPFVGDKERVRMTGPETHLSPRVTLIMSMALHELSTNAAKYGALSNSSGRVSIDWDTVEKTDGSKDFKFFWVESGGPTVSVPKQRGFGSGLIERALATELGGVATLAFQPEGLGCQIRATLSNDLV